MRKSYPQPDGGYDLVAFFDCLHDMGDPLGAIKHTAQALAPDGTVMIVEPMAGDRVEQNLNPVGRIYSAASVMVCTPNAVATGNTHLGTIATDETMERSCSRVVCHASAGRPKRHSIASLRRNSKKASPGNRHWTTDRVTMSAIATRNMTLQIRGNHDEAIIH